MPELEWADSFQIQTKAIAGDPASFSPSRVDLQKEWNGVGIGNNQVGVVANSTARGTSALYIPFGGSILRTLSHQATFTIGMRIKIGCVDGIGGSNSLFDFSNNSTPLSSLRIKLDGSILLFCDNNQSRVVFDSVTPLIVANQEVYIELTTTISGTTTLSIQSSLWVNDTFIGTGSHATSHASTDLPSQDATLNRITLNAGVTSNGQCLFSDLYIIKGTTRLGTNVFPFGVEIDPIFTISDSTPITWSPTGGGSHWDQINDNPPNAEATYVEASVIGTVDSYNWETVPNFAGTIPSVFMKLLCRSTAEGLSRTQGNVGAGGSQAQTEIFGLCASAYYQCHSFDVDPLTGVAWLPAAFNTRPFGIQIS